MQNVQQATRVTAAAVCLLILTSYSASFGKEKTFELPRAFHAKTYPAKDVHEDEKLTVAADPYDTDDKTKPVFAVKYRENGLLPIHLMISNDSDQPVSLADMQVLFIGKKGTKLDQERPEDIYRRISRLKRTDQPSANPLPLPRKHPHSLSREAEEEVQGAQFMARAVEPHSTQSGFLFFDVIGIDNPLAGARIEISGIKNSQGQEVFFFEIQMEKYLSYQPLK